MLSRWKKLNTRLPHQFFAAFALGMGFLAFVAWDQSYWWRIKEDYYFGWLVPVFVIFVVRERWPKVLTALAACSASGSPRATGGGKWLLRSLAGGALAFGLLVFLLGAFYRAGWGISQPGTLAITMGAVAIVLSLMVISAPAPAVVDGHRATPPPCGLAEDPRVKLVGLFVFPAVIWLVSAPMVSAVEAELNVALLRRVVNVVAFVFDVLGLPIEQQGNVLTLPNGNVGVEDACSGIRSLTGCLFAGSFLAAIFLERIGKKLALVVAALVLAFLTNLGRSLFLTAWAYHYGPRAIEGMVHDIAGYAVLALTVAGLLALLPLLTLKIGMRATGGK